MVYHASFVQEYLEKHLVFVTKYFVFVIGKILQKVFGMYLNTLYVTCFTYREDVNVSVGITAKGNCIDIKAFKISFIPVR